MKCNFDGGFSVQLFEYYIYDKLKVLKCVFNEDIYLNERSKLENVSSIPKLQFGCYFEFLYSLLWFFLFPIMLDV